MASATHRGRRTVRAVLAAGVLLAALTGTAWRATASTAAYQRSAVLASPTSSQVTILVGGLRKDLTLQPTAQIIPVDMTSGSMLNSVFLYNPGPGPDGLLRFSAKDTTISTTFTPMPVNGRYRPFAFGNGIFWYAPGAGADSIWTFSTDGKRYTSKPASVGGDYTPVLWQSRACCDSTATTKAIIWYAPGTARDFLWVFDRPNGAHSDRPLRIDGRYRAIPGHFILDGPYDPADILWYSQDGSEYVWSVQGDPWDYRSTRVGDIGPGARPVVGRYVPKDLGPVAVETVLWYFPGPETETYWTADTGRMTSKPAGSINGNYRAVAFGVNDVLFLGPGTTGKLTHFTENGPTGSFDLSGLPAGSIGVSGYLLTVI